MELGEIFYIIIVVVIGITSLMGKKKKPKITAHPTPTRDIFQDLFDLKNEEEEINVEDDIKDIEDTIYTIEDESEIAPTPIKEEITPKLVDSEKTFPSKKKHSLLDDLKKRREIQKAVIYSEIFKPKF